METRDDDKAAGVRGVDAAPAGQAEVNWDPSSMRSVYADVCKITGARDEIVLLFGKNQVRHAGREELTIQLEDRVVMSPLAAKRFFTLLSDVLKDYEDKYGTIEKGAVQAHADSSVRQLGTRVRGMDQG